MLSHATGGAIALPADTGSGDTSTATLLTRGLRAALAGDRGEAQRQLEAARARPRSDLVRQGAAPALLQAWIAGSSGRWDEVVRVLGPGAPRPLEIPAMYTVGLSATRWTLAEAYERLGQPDSAAVWMERVASDYARLDEGIHYRGVVLPAAHQRLILLYARMERLADAERHLAILEHWWDRPDDVARRMLGEARAAVANARGMARPEHGGS
jgi:hypothetical protein